MSRATLISILEQPGSAYGTAKTAVTHLPYLERVSQGQYRILG